MRRAVLACVLICACDRMAEIEIDGKPVDVTVEAEVPAFPSGRVDLSEQIELLVDRAEPRQAHALVGVEVIIQQVELRNADDDSDLALSTWPQAELWLAGERLLGPQELAQLAAGRPVEHAFSGGVVDYARRRLAQGLPLEAELRVAARPPDSVIQAAPMLVRCRVRATPRYTLDLLGVL